MKWETRDGTENWKRVEDDKLRLDVTSGHIMSLLLRDVIKIQNYFVGEY